MRPVTVVTTGLRPAQERAGIGWRASGADCRNKVVESEDARKEG